MEQAKEKQSFLGTVMVISLSLVLMVVAALLLFVPQIKLLYICYFICAAAVAAGIYMIVRYFMTDAFQNMNEYGFSEGVLLIILGICGMLRAEKLAASFLVILGIALAFSGIVKLQYAMDLKRMKDVVWIFILLLSVIILAASMFVILQPFAGQSWFDTTTWYIMLCDGGVNLLVLGYMAIRLKLYHKKEMKEKEKTEETSALNDNTKLQAESTIDAVADAVAEPVVQQNDEEVFKETINEAVQETSADCVDESIQ